MMKAWRVTDEGLMLTVRLTPKGGRDAVDGIETLSDGRVVLKARVRAAPEDNAANKALIALMADCLALPRTHITLATGATARLKTLALQGNSLKLTASLSALISRKDRP